MSNDLVVLDNSIIKASYNLSVSEQRLILSALAQIPKGVPISANKAYYISREHFIRLGANPDQATRDIRVATKDLMKKTLFIQTEVGELEFHWLREVMRFDKNAEAKLRSSFSNTEDYNKYLETLRRYNLVEGLPPYRETDDIVVKIVFNERILPLLSDLKANFTQFMLEDVVGFSSIYSFRIYQLMMRYKDSGWVKIKIDDLRYMLALNDKYKATKDLKVWVIEVALREINQRTPYKVSYELEKTGRKFSHLKLKFKEKSKKDSKILEEKFNNDVANRPSWEKKGLSDAQIAKISCNLREFVDANSDKISPADHRDYAPIFEEWKHSLKDPKQITSFRKVQELLERGKP